MTAVLEHEASREFWAEFARIWDATTPPEAHLTIEASAAAWLTETTPANLRQQVKRGKLVKGRERGYQWGDLADYRTIARPVGRPEKPRTHERLVIPAPTDGRRVREHATVRLFRRIRRDLAGPERPQDQA